MQALPLQRPGLSASQRRKGPFQPCRSRKPLDDSDVLYSQERNPCPQGGQLACRVAAWGARLSEAGAGRVAADGNVLRTMGLCNQYQASEGVDVAPQQRKLPQSHHAELEAHCTPGLCGRLGSRSLQQKRKTRWPGPLRVGL